MENQEQTEEIIVSENEAAFDALLQALETKDTESLIEIVDSMTISDALRYFLWLDDAQKETFLNLLPHDLSAELIAELPLEHAGGVVEQLEEDIAVGILSEMETDLQADVLGELTSENADSILAKMDQQEAEEVRNLVQYDENTAGGLMKSEVFSFHTTDTVGLILRTMASEDEEFERFRGQHPYVIDENDKLVGVVSLRTMLSEKRSVKLADVMVPAVSLPVNMHIDDIEDIFIKEDFLTLPVLDANNVLLGVVTRTTLQDAVYEKSEADNMKRHGVVGDELRSMPLFLRSRRRLAWLSANIVLNILAASVISSYEDTLTAVIAIAVFLPMVSDMSGCSGNQAVAVSLRELALGTIKPIDMARVWSKEVSLGMINGLVLGMLIGVVAWGWKGNPFLGVVIGAALMINTVIAVSIGGVVPLLLKRFNQDPAVASGPLLTTITDMAGFFLVLSLASLMMPFLV
ncbi:MAG: magnesium transporter [Methylocystaceae bacterium]|nr:magnesium transporter [Methylocystaceae bacterium]